MQKLSPFLARRDDDAFGTENLTTELMQLTWIQFGRFFWGLFRQDAVKGEEARRRATPEKTLAVSFDARRQEKASKEISQNQV